MINKSGEIFFNIPKDSEDRRKLLIDLENSVGVILREENRSFVIAPYKSEHISGNCYYCGKPVNSLAGNPSEWGILLCHTNEPGKVKPHHIGCVSQRLGLAEKVIKWAKEF